MKKFSYSLQKVLDLREFELKQAEVALGKINSQIAALNNQLKTIAMQRLNVQKDMDSSFDLNFFAQGWGYTVFLQQKKDECLQHIAELQVQADKQKEVVKEAMQKQKVLEKLRESKYNAWKKENLRLEEIVMDDVVTAKYGSASRM